MKRIGYVTEHRDVMEPKGVVKRIGYVTEHRDVMEHNKGCGET